MPPLFVDGVEIKEVFVDGVEQDTVFSDGVEVFNSYQGPPSPIILDYIDNLPHDMVAGIDFPHNVNLQICVAGGGGGAKYRNGAGGGSGNNPVFHTFPKGEVVSVTVGLRGAGGHDSQLGETDGSPSNFGTYSVASGGQRGLATSGGAGGGDIGGAGGTGANVAGQATPATDCSPGFPGGPGAGGPGGGASIWAAGASGAGGAPVNHGTLGSGGGVRWDGGTQGFGGNGRIVLSWVG